jgi:hypothetical protein
MSIQANVPVAQAVSLPLNQILQLSFASLLFTTTAVAAGVIVFVQKQRNSTLLLVVGTLIADAIFGLAQIVLGIFIIQVFARGSLQ